MGRIQTVNPVSVSKLHTRLIVLRVEPMTAQQTMAYLKFAVESSKTIVELGAAVSEKREVPVALASAILGLPGSAMDVVDNKTVKAATVGASELGSDVSLIAVVRMASRAKDPLSPAAYGGALTAILLQKGLTVAGITTENQKAQCAIAIGKLATDIIISGATIETGIGTWIGVMAAAQAFMDGATAGNACYAAFAK